MTERGAGGDLGEAGWAPDPIIVTGSPRSGVRLLAAILDGHPKLASGPDLALPVTVARQWQEIQRTLGVNHERHYGLQPEVVRGSFRAVVLRVLAPRLEKTGKRRFVIHSFAAAVSLEALAALFPSAQFILMSRDPRDVTLSLLRCDWRNPRDGQRLPYTQDIAAAARHWADFMQLSWDAASALEGEGRLLRVRYEDLCTEPGSAMRRLGGFLGESMPDASVSVDSAALVTASLDNPHPALRTGTVTSASVGAWRRALSAQQVACVDAMTATESARLGYH